MEELLSALFEFLFEFLLEIFMEGGSALLNHFFDDLERDPLIRKRIKYGIGFTFFCLSILVLILSLIFKQDLIATIILIYLLCLVLYHMLMFINKNIWEKKYINIILNWFKRIVKYSFLIILICVGNLILDSGSAIAWLNTLSIIFIIIYLAIDIYKLRKFIIKYKNNVNEKKNNKIVRSYYDDMEDRY